MSPARSWPSTPRGGLRGDSPSPLTDDKGFFKQWASVADERGVEVLYSNLEFDLEAVISFDPDLVVVASSGKDSVADQVETIKQQFPVIVVDYGKQSWQDLATQLGKALGLEDKATAAGTEFDSYIKEAKGKITPPEGGASIVSYNGKDKDQAIAKKDSAHADLLTSLGLEVVEADASLDSGNRQRNDFMFVSYENLSKAITGESVFLISTGQDQVQKFLDDETLANLPAVTNNQVYYLGPTSFRIDFYSGSSWLTQSSSSWGRADAHDPCSPPQWSGCPDGPLMARTRRLVLVVALLMAALVVLLVASLAIGSRLIPTGTVMDALTNFDPGSDDQLVIRFSRLPRTLIGVLAGAALGLAGVLTQSLTRNALAEPGTLGVNAGAAVGVIIGLIATGGAR